ncbi:MAG TPA: SMC family ATPase, partial [Myxococcota bacterium]|nr:SMC family ATPase [Myxococcota bacterium]
MRPLRLKVSGLTCFRDEVTLDLAPLSLVAIAGPTGAGKSTLLDAMILSLYGFVPRMGTKNLTELISHGRAALSVVFDFEVADKRYRVARSIYRGKRASQALLSELTAEAQAETGAPKETRIASGIKEVQEQVKGLLGIDGEAFTQAVILPQGRFQDFLKATPGDRRKILNELLGLRVYDLMRVKAHELAVKRAAEIEALEAQLGDLADLDEGALAA